MGVVRMPDGSLEAARPPAPAATIIRGDRLPKDLYGKYLYGEQVARIVRRMSPENKEGLTYDPQRLRRERVHQVHGPVLPAGRSEDCARRHALHRRTCTTASSRSGSGRVPAPTSARASSSTISTRSFTTAASGGSSTTASSRADAIARDKTMPRMNNETRGAARDASRPSERLVARHRAAAARPQAGQVGRAGARRQLAATSTQPARDGFHALWTLEGLGALDAVLVRQLMEDPRAAHADPGDSRERDALQGRRRVVRRRLQAPLTKDSNVDVVIQAMLTMNRWKVPDATTTIKATMDANKARGVQVVATTFSTGGGERRAAGGGGVGADVRAAGAPRRRAARSTTSLCISCHAPDGMGSAAARTTDDAGAAARGIAARERPPRLHRQGRAARSDRADRRHDSIRR